MVLGRMAGARYYDERNEVRFLKHSFLTSCLFLYINSLICTAHTQLGKPRASFPHQQHTISFFVNANLHAFIQIYVRLIVASLSVLDRFTNPSSPFLRPTPYELMSNILFKHWQR